MRIRHKIPSIFSLSMVDMLCCALGCVILVWLLNARMSQEEIEESHLQLDELRAQVNADRLESQRLLASARSERDQVSSHLRQLTTERDQLASRLRELTAERDRLVASASRLEDERSRLSGLLASEQKQSKQLAGELATARERLQGLESDMRSTTARLEEERKRVAGLDRQLTERLTELRGLRADLSAGEKRLQTEKARLEALTDSMERQQKELATVNRQLAEAVQARDRLNLLLAERQRDLEKALSREEALKKDLEKRQANMTATEKAFAQAERERQAALALANARVASLEKESARLRAAAENRFAGITLTGRRVVFLVDASGSMYYVDEKTVAPQKWTEVANTVALLMRSLPDLEKYQLIVFNRSERFPLGQIGQWIDYDPRRSPDQVRKVLEEIRPSGGTNLYAGLKAAFDYRPLGLDVIYLLSDGLPSVGEGLSPEQAKTLNEQERALILGRHIRDTLNRDWNVVRPGLPKVRINSIGFYYESPDLGSFLWALSREHDGNFVGMSRP
jgi:uncharacterized coiled-coil DUF342 family protein